ncbi:hypothetical protein Musp01_28620 [Muricauda sp. NBRC 101325]|nr:hypothetical protein Musp01_28620 [Muricauda sp. NBRC 101325]
MNLKIKRQLNPSKAAMKNRYKEGDFVIAKVRPSVILVIQVDIRNVYYCAILDNNTAKELVYLNSELRPYLGHLFPSKWNRMIL